VARTGLFVHQTSHFHSLTISSPYQMFAANLSSDLSWHERLHDQPACV
jgi:hypothetical protein